jgi:hypothetical protein
MNKDIETKNKIYQYIKMGQSVSYPRQIEIEITPTYKGKRPSITKVEKFIRSKRWLNELRYALPDSFTKKAVKMKDNKIYITGIAKNNSFSKEYIKDGFHKATHAGDPIKITGTELYIKYNKVKITYK